MGLKQAYQDLKSKALHASMQAQHEINKEFNDVLEIAALFKESPSPDNFRMLEIQIAKSRRKVLNLADVKI